MNRSIVVILAGALLISIAIFIFADSRSKFAELSLFGVIAVLFILWWWRPKKPN